MLHHRRHVVHRNTFRCTCCCCSQITKYQTHYVPPWRAQGIGLTRVGGFLWARHSGTRRAATLAHATPSTTCGTSKHLPLHVLLCCCCSQITKYQTHYVPPWRAQGIGLTALGDSSGRDTVVHVVQPPLPMLHHRRHVVHRNTFRCTCCCCSQITKYQTHYVPPWRAQGIGLTRVGGFLWARHSGTRRAATLAHATPSTTCGTSKHLPLHVLLLFSNYQVPNSLRTAVARPGNRANARWGIPLGAT